jgi:hypothetical protein
MLSCGGGGGGSGRAGAGGTAAAGAAGTAQAGAGGIAAAGAGGAAGAVGVAGGGRGAGGATGAAGSTAGTAGGAGIAGASGAAGAGGTTPFTPLDMNDATILAPLPASSATPVLLLGSDLAEDGTALVPRALFDRVVADGATGKPLPTLDTAYARLHLVAVRFDLCDRHLPGVCPAAEDGRLRLVFQPLSDASGAQDVGFHAFYTIGKDEIPGAVAALRELATTAPPQSGALRVSPALSAANPQAYATKLRAFVRRYGGEGRIVRLTMNAQNLNFSAIAWALRGVEKQGNAFVDMVIVGATATSESVTFTGNPGYAVTPLTDTPSGLLGAIAQTMFDAADAAKKREFLQALAAIDNPLSHTAETVACVACHVSTVMMKARASSTAIDPLTLAGRYASKYDLGIDGGKSAETPTTLRALGYLGKQPMISQRVVNDTAQTLTEIAQRYPAP